MADNPGQNGWGCRAVPEGREFKFKFKFKCKFKSRLQTGGGGTEGAVRI
jgi:hypothetical protein